jgi:hypothetical protein
MLAAGLVVAGCQSGKKSSAASSAAAVSSAAAASSAAASAAAGSGAASSGPASSGSAGSGSAPAVGGKPGYGIDPLTGAPAASAAAAKRPALAVKVDNVLGAWPQAGLNQADIVYDIPVEGGLTRLLAIFHSQDVALIGPIRSARPVDADLLHQYGHSYFAFSGGTASDLGPIENHSLATPMWWDVTPSLFVTRSDHAVPHQVFSSTARLYAGGEQRAPSTTPPPAIFSYGNVSAAATPAKSVVAQYAAATATWTWNGHYYVRDQNGHPDLLIDGTQVSSTNVVIMSVAVTNTSAHDSHGTVVPLPLVIGAGTAWIFRGGTVVKGTWSRPSENSETTFKVGSSVMSLAPGRTWVEILPNSTQPRIS